VGGFECVKVGEPDGLSVGASDGFPVGGADFSSTAVVELKLTVELSNGSVKTSGASGFISLRLSANALLSSACLSPLCALEIAAAFAAAAAPQPEISQGVAIRCTISSSARGPFFAAFFFFFSAI